MQPLQGMFYGKPSVDTSESEVLVTGPVQPQAATPEP